MKNIYLLSSTRADYSIYLPLMKALLRENKLNLRVVAFGTHPEKAFGCTLNKFKEDNIEVYQTFKTYSPDDSPLGISNNVADVMSLFAGFWEQEKNQVDLLIALGDRFEMFAAVASAVPFRLPIAHLHGGETTLGAIDNIYRHAISLCATLHFTATHTASQRLKELLGEEKGIFATGALAIDSIQSVSLLSISQLREQFGIDLLTPSILFTFHPETTLSMEENVNHIKTLLEVVSETKYQVIITLPNADTYGTSIRDSIFDFCKNREAPFFLFESMGVVGYYSAMKHCAFVMGNSSSGIIEAASFGKYAINVGDRQKGRESGANVLHTPIEKTAIQARIKAISTLPALDSNNIYGDGNATSRIVSHIIDFLKVV
ncbi:MAG: UDP-N-acetylglucosamine 2-epimerase [Cytophagaceae bacterium]|nr:UDP-N-acetylglucosamine 2-epimerase [Cytophagaceae bacterium]